MSLEIYTVAFTGHRSEKINTDGTDRGKSWVKGRTGYWLKQGKASLVITGMANGYDLWAAETASFYNIPWICAVPYKGHKPRKGDEDLYNFLLENAQEVVYVTDYEEYPGPWVYQKRNEWMVDRGDKVLACWDGVESGGTWNCIKYARKQEKKIKVIDPHEHKEIPF